MLLLLVKEEMHEHCNKTYIYLFSRENSQSVKSLDELTKGIAQLSVKCIFDSDLDSFTSALGITTLGNKRIDVTINSPASNKSATGRLFCKLQETMLTAVDGGAPQQKSIEPTTYSYTFLPQQFKCTALPGYNRDSNELVFCCAPRIDDLFAVDFRLTPSHDIGPRRIADHANE